MTAPSLFNIPPGRSFVDALARGIVERADGGSSGLSDHILLLPNRRAARVLREAFLRLSEGRALLLPRMYPLGDLDAEEIAIRAAGDDDLGDLADIPPAISRLERQVLLARLIVQRETLARSFDQAAALANELGTLLDQMQTEGIGFEKLSDLVEGDMARHWQVTLKFLEIVTEHWPKILAERGLIDPADRRNRLLKAQAALWQKSPPKAKVIAAGSTGSVPAAADLLRTVACLPNGALVLPGLDAGMDDEAWEHIGEDHPQYNLKRLIEGLGVDRRAVPEWTGQGKVPVNKARVRLISEALRPAETTGSWRNLVKDGSFTGALSNFTRIDCATPEEEASVIALILRSALETPEKTAALITPDRNLTRRVAAALSRWGILADDSGGAPLAEASPGLWFDLVGRMAVDRFAPLPLLACLKHELCSLDRQKIVLFETGDILRGPRPAPGIAGLRTALGKARDAAPLMPLVDDLEVATRAMTALLDKGKAPFGDLLRAHLAAMENLAGGADKVWRGEAGELLAGIINEAANVGSVIPDLSGDEYLALMKGFMHGKAVRVAKGPHPRISILGQIEARLFQPDLVVLGGLNEGSWPAEPAHDPWMSRPMRVDLGLPSPERSIGLSAHDFMQAATSPEVVVTRSCKQGGAPTVPARWLLRLDVVLEHLGLEIPAARAHQWKSWAHMMDAAAEVKSCMAPAPTPPLDARPGELSVTGVERWMRDPYEVYARYILGLKALDPVDADPGADIRGQIIHTTLEHFIRDHMDRLPDDAEQKLLDCGRRAFDAETLPPEVRAYWWARFERVVPEFIRKEREWRQDFTPLAVEVKGSAKLGDFTLTAKADRIDRAFDGTLAIMDYKTGGLPTKKDIELGFSPQLPLEAVIAEEGGFAGIAAGKVSKMAFWQLKGTAREALKDTEVDKPEIVEKIRAGLERRIADFARVETPYVSRPRPDKAPRYSDYTHLARIGEWSIAGDEEGGEGE